MGNLYQKTLSPFEQVQLIIANSLSQVNTILPCVITEVNYPKVTVKPSIERVFINENNQREYLDYAEVSDIPILTLGSNQFNISFPKPIVGDVGLLLVCQAQVSKIYDREEDKSIRKFSLTDGVFIPLFMKSESSEDDKITVNTDKFNVKNSSHELIASIISALTAVKNLSTTAPAVVDPGSQAAIQAEIDKIQSFQ
jgi:hypothetical protein